MSLMQDNTVRAAATGFASRVMGLLEKIQYKRVETKEELEAVQHLRYTAYLKEGAIGMSAEEKLLDPFDEAGNFTNFGVYLKNKLVGAVRIHLLESTNDISPALDAFPDVLVPLLKSGKRIVDPNRYVVDYETARSHPELAYVTVRLAVAAGFYYDANFVTATVRAEHQAFYKRSFFARAACEPRTYPTLSKKISLMFIDYENDRARILDRNPFYVTTAEEQASLFGKNGNNQSDSKLQSAA